MAGLTWDKVQWCKAKRSLITRNQGALGHVRFSTVSKNPDGSLTPGLHGRYIGLGIWVKVGLAFTYKHPKFGKNG